MTITVSQPFIYLIATVVSWLIGLIIQKTSVDGKGTPFAILPMMFFYGMAFILLIVTLIKI